MTLEERIKRIEDRLGITEEDTRKDKLSSIKKLAIEYGMSNAKAKGFAWEWNRVYGDNVDIREVEEYLITRGAVRVSNNG